MNGGRTLSIISDERGRFDIFLQVEGEQPEYMGPVDALKFRVSAGRPRRDLPCVCHVHDPAVTSLVFLRRPSR